MVHGDLEKDRSKGLKFDGRYIVRSHALMPSVGRFILELRTFLRISGRGIFFILQVYEGFLVVDSCSWSLRVMLTDAENFNTNEHRSLLKKQPRRKYTFM